MNKKKSIVENYKDDFIYYKNSPTTICITGYIGNNTEIYLPNYLDSLPVTSMISTAFQDNDNITKFVFNDNLEEIIIDNSSDLQVFDGLKNLETVYFGISIKHIDEDYFDYCTSLKTFVVNSENPYYKSNDGIVYSKDMSEVVLCPQQYPNRTLRLPDTTLTVLNYCFEECVNIETLNLNNVTKIDDISFQGTTLIMKGDCVLNPKIKFSNLTNIEFISEPTQENIDYCKDHKINYIIK